MQRQGLRILRSILLICILSALLASMPVSTASAALRTCRTDPVIFLSNGTKLAITADIAADVQNVSRIVYTVRIPAGVAVTNVVFTGGAIATREMVFAIADQPAGSYVTETVVHTAGPAVDVHATFAILIGVAKTAYGRSGEKLVIPLQMPNQGSRREIKPEYR